MCFEWSHGLIEFQSAPIFPSLSLSYFCDASVWPFLPSRHFQTPAVLIPPDFSLPDSLDPKDNIIETADDAGFNTLLAALDLVSLTEVLENEEALFTVFAPTDDAFAALPTDIFNFLLKDFGGNAYNASNLVSDFQKW